MQVEVIEIKLKATVRADGVRFKEDVEGCVEMSVVADGSQKGFAEGCLYVPGDTFQSVGFGGGQGRVTRLELEDGTVVHALIKPMPTVDSERNCWVFRFETSRPVDSASLKRWKET